MDEPLDDDGYMDEFIDPELLEAAEKLVKYARHNPGGYVNPHRLCMPKVRFPKYSSTKG
jgi:hypothetical protein